MFSPYIVIFGALVQFWGGTVYLWATLKGRVKPNRVSFALWAAAPLIGTAAALSAGVRWAILPTFIAGFLPALIFAASFVDKQAYWKLRRFDYLCGAFSVLALVLWYLTKDPVIAIVFAILSDALASVPTIVKAWHYPETEIAWPYLTTGFAAFLSLFAVQSWAFPEYGFSLYLIVITALIVSSVYGKRLVGEEVAMP